MSKYPQPYQLVTAEFSATGGRLKLPALRHPHERECQILGTQYALFLVSHMTNQVPLNPDCPLLTSQKNLYQAEHQQVILSRYQQSVQAQKIARPHHQIFRESYCATNSGFVDTKNVQF